MSESLDRFRGMMVHDCGGRKVIIADQGRYEIRVECGCGVKWAWKLFSELKLRRPEGYCEWLFRDGSARARLGNFINGVLVISEEVEV